MPIIKAAKKAMRGDARKRVFNDRRRRAMKAEIKSTRELAGAGKKDEAKAGLSAAYKAIDKALKRGIIKKNTASRKKSRLSKLVSTK